MIAMYSTVHTHCQHDSIFQYIYIYMYKYVYVYVYVIL